MKTTTISITLPSSLVEYVNERVKEGQFNTVSDYICWLIQEDMRRRDEKKAA